MCSFEAYGKNHKPVNEHKPVNDETSSGGARPLSSSSTEEALKYFGLKLNFIESSRLIMKIEQKWFLKK